MQPPPLPRTSSVSYQLSRAEVQRVWWRRTIFRPKFLAFAALFLLCIPLSHLSAPGSDHFVIPIVLVLIAGLPVSIYFTLGRAIDQNRQLTDPRSLEFGPEQLVATGPDWRTEFSWTLYRGFSEDPRYFYFHLNNSGLVSLIPKRAFSPEQESLFRQCARAHFPA